MPNKILLNTISEIPIPLQIEVPDRNPPAASVKTNCKALIEGSIEEGEGRILLQLGFKDEFLKSMILRAISKLVSEAPITTNVSIKVVSDKCYNPLGVATLVVLEVLKLLEKIHEEELDDNDRIDIVSSVMRTCTLKSIGVFKTLCYTALHNKPALYSATEGVIEVNDKARINLAGVDGYVLANPVKLPSKILDQLAKLSSIVLVELVFNLNENFTNPEVLRIYNLIWAQTHRFEGELIKSLNEHRKMIVPGIDKYVFIITVLGAGC